MMYSCLLNYIMTVAFRIFGYSEAVIFVIDHKIS